MKRILITGANGFVGSAVVDKIFRDGLFEVRAAARQMIAGLPDNVRMVQVAALEDHGNWKDALSGINMVIHTAARVHIMNDAVSNPLAEFRKVNVEGTLNLARQAAEAGVNRFIFISSIKVNGEFTPTGQAFTADDIPAPKDTYGISKHEAEVGLREIAKKTGMAVVIIRPPLVYGADVKANFLSMMRWLSKGLPLPLGAIRNQRSLVGLSNLVDLIITCLHHPAAANQTFLASDGEDLSTTQLLHRTGIALGKPARLLPVPAWLIGASASLIGKGDIAQRLCSNLQVDISKTRYLLGWTPPMSLDKGLQFTARAYLNSKAP